MMSQEYSSDSAMSPSGSSQTSSSSQNTPCKVTMYSPILLMASGANTPVKVTPSNTPCKVTMYSPIPLMASGANTPVKVTPSNTPTKTPTKTPTNTCLDDLEQNINSNHLVFDTHLKAALYSISKKEVNDASDSIEKVRRLMKGHMAKSILLIKETKNEVSADKNKIAELTNQNAELVKQNAELAKKKANLNQKLEISKTAMDLLVGSMVADKFDHDDNDHDDDDDTLCAKKMKGGEEA